MPSGLGTKHAMSDFGGGLGGSGSQMSLNGLTMASSSENLFHPGQPSSAHDDMGGDAKRRRIAKACDMCRKKKIKCDGNTPKCGHCVSSKSECVFTRTEKKRNPPKGAKYIESLENRLIRMEKVLKLSGVVPEIDDGKTDLGELEKRLSERRNRDSMASDTASPSVNGMNSPRTSEATGCMTPRTSTQQSNVGSPSGDNEVEVLSDMMCSLVTSCHGESRFLGSSTAFSIFSPRGMQWLAEKVGDDAFKESFTKMLSASANSFPNADDGLFSKPLVKTPLPSKEVAMSLVNDYFKFFNVLLPIYDKSTFEALVEKQYSNDPPRKPSWYCAFNMMLAVACRLRITHGPPGTAGFSSTHNHEQSLVYYNNAISVLLQVMMTSTDLLAIQGLVCMALYVQGSSNPHTGYMLIATAARLAATIGMHRKGTFFQLDPVEAQQRQRVFWVIYIVDKDISLRAGRPSIINDDDISLELPKDEPDDGLGMVDLKDGQKTNLFRHFIRFSRISSKVYLRLYSATAAKQSDGELLNTIGALDEELEDWRLTLPEEVRPGCAVTVPEGPVLLPLVVMHFAYFNCLTTIHRMSIHHGYWTNRLSDFAIQGLNPSPLNPRVFLSASICVNAARDSLNLTKHLRLSDYPCNWLILYYPMAAFITLFSNILQNPQEPRARSDYALMKNVEEFVSVLTSSDTERSENTDRMLLFVKEFVNIAGLVLERSDKEHSGRRKRRAEDKMEVTMAKKDMARRTTPMVEVNGVPRSPSGTGAAATTPQGSTVPSSNDLLFNPHTSQPYTPPSNFAWLEESSPAASPQIPTMPFPQDSQFASQQSATNHSPLTMSSFQQPVMPPDLWQMPMTFEWDWDMGLHMNGNVGEGGTGQGGPNWTW